ncbi:hypothetical protein OPV22_019410 [Ensete ventricosum]|uniref:Uncharacterized protein n=1 Tax=Ensete ventricosum TaxID=4639 RepID=A0AAV8QGC6_ENSVE|nr:hypothetical protein OPV22_019410 [Ensete ventricosum]
MMLSKADGFTCNKEDLMLQKENKSRKGGICPGRVFFLVGITMDCSQELQQVFLKNQKAMIHKMVRETY